MFEKEYCVVRKIMFVTHRNVAAGAVFEFKCFVAKVLNRKNKNDQEHCARRTNLKLSSMQETDGYNIKRKAFAWHEVACVK